MKFHVTKTHLFLKTTFVLHLSGSIDTNNEMSYVFNAGLITPLDSS